MRGNLYPSMGEWDGKHFNDHHEPQLSGVALVVDLIPFSVIFLVFLFSVTYIGISIYKCLFRTLCSKFFLRFLRFWCCPLKKIVSEWIDYSNFDEYIQPQKKFVFRSPLIFNRVNNLQQESDMNMYRDVDKLVVSHKSLFIHELRFINALTSVSFKISDAKKITIVEKFPFSLSVSPSSLSLSLSLSFLHVCVWI